MLFGTVGCRLLSVQKVTFAIDHCPHTVLRDFSTFSPPASSFFWPFLFSDLLASSLLFSDSSHLCFSICPSCAKFDFETSFACIHFRCSVAMRKHKKQATKQDCAPAPASVGHSVSHRHEPPVSRGRRQRA